MAAESSDRHAVVVVGIHGGRAAVAAMSRALAEARAVSGLVEMVTAWTARDVTDAPSLWAAGREARRRAVAHQRAAVAACGDAGGVLITGVVAEGRPQDLLLLAGRGAACVVLGRSVGGRSSITRTCAAGLECPVLEARADAPAHVPRQRSAVPSVGDRLSPDVGSRSRRGRRMA